MLLGQVVQLGAVSLDVIELPGTIGPLCHQLPLSITQSPVALVLPEDGLRPSGFPRKAGWRLTPCLGVIFFPLNSVG